VNEDIAEEIRVSLKEEDKFKSILDIVSKVHENKARKWAEMAIAEHGLRGKGTLGGLWFSYFKEWKRSQKRRSR
jgi:hypothetical protein